MLTVESNSEFYHVSVRTPCNNLFSRTRDSSVKLEVALQSLRSITISSLAIGQLSTH